MAYSIFMLDFLGIIAVLGSLNVIDECFFLPFRKLFVPKSNGMGLY
jgi:hypothetical protein